MTDTAKHNSPQRRRKRTVIREEGKGFFHGLGRRNVGTYAASTAFFLFLSLIPILILLSSLLAACVTAFAGPISFVGIAVPHLARRLLATARPLALVPATFLAGSVFCLACDLVARNAFAPTEVSVSTITALVGAPMVVWVLLRRERGDVA